MHSLSRNERNLRFAIPIVAAVSLAACGIATNGLGPPESGSAEDGGVGLDANAGATDATGQADTSLDGASAPTHPSNEASASMPPDAARDDAARDDAAMNPSPPDGCTPAAQEDCTNGTDDDCNGLADCADPACATAGYTCVDAPPTGWTAASFSGTSRPGCPSALPTQTNVDVDPTALTSPAICGCSCALGTPPSCVQGDLATKYGPDNTCNAVAAPVDVPAGDGGCTVQTATVAPFISATQPPLSGGSCTLTSTVNRPSPGATRGQVCTGQSAFGAGCGTGQVCALVPTGYQACILQQSAQVACPAGAYATPHAVGTLDDSRGCTTCACALPTATCAPGTWSFFTAANCTGPAIDLATNGVCNAAGAPPMGSPTGSNQFTSAMSDIACPAPAAATPTGTVQLKDANTVCCE